MKKLFCLSMAVLLAFSLTACSTETGESTESVVSGKDNDFVESGGIVNNSVAEEVIEKSELANKQYGGKEFRFYYWYQPNEIVTRKVAAFNEAHDAKVKVEVLTGDFQENIATSIASGTPFDMIANHGMYFPQTIFSDLYEPLEGYIKDVDYFQESAPDNGGLSQVVNAAFTWKNKLYAAGSAKAVYQYVVYYNKKMFTEAGLEDPYELWKNDQWTWEKFTEMGTEVTDIAGGKGFLTWPDLTVWMRANGVEGVVQEGDSFKENLGDAKTLEVINAYRDLAFGDNPVSIVGDSNQFGGGKSYTMIAVTDAYTNNAQRARTSSAFGRDANNLGVVPVPNGLCADGKYPGHAPQGYSAAKGAADPSVAACYALFESRIQDSDVGSEMQMPVDVRDAVETAFAANGFIGFDGLQDSNGVYYNSVINRNIGLVIRDGGDVASTVNGQRSVIERIINDVMSRAI